MERVTKLHMSSPDPTVAPQTGLLVKMAFHGTFRFCKLRDVGQDVFRMDKEKYTITNQIQILKTAGWSLVRYVLSLALGAL